MKEFIKETNIMIVVIILLNSIVISVFLTSCIVNKEKDAVTIKVSKEMISNSVEESGYIESSNIKNIYFKHDVIINEFLVENDDLIEEGDVIGYVSSDALDNLITEIETKISDIDSQLRNMNRDDEAIKEVKSPVSGLVKKINIKNGSIAYSGDDGIMLISADNKLKIICDLEENIELGREVCIHIGEQTYEGFVIQVSDEGTIVIIEDSKDISLDEVAEIFDMELNKLGNGIIECNAPYLLMGKYGFVDEVLIKENDFVDTETVLFTLENSKYSDTYISLIQERNKLLKKLENYKQEKKEFVITATVSGVISNLNANEGDIITAFNPICKIVETDSIIVIVYTEEENINDIFEGQDVEVKIDALDKTMRGTVKKISYLENDSSIKDSYKTYIEISDINNLRIGMNVTVKFIINGREAVVVPEEAIINSNGESCVRVKEDNNKIVSRKVELGEYTEDGKVEIVSGLDENEIVLSNVGN